MAWDWGTLSDAKIGALLNGPMKALEDYLRRNERYMPTQAIARTTDATVTTIATYPIPVNTTVQIEGRVIARRTGGSAGSTNDGAGYHVLVVARNTAGTATVIGASITTVGEDQAAFAVTAPASSGNVLIRVAGAANNNVVWAWNGSVISVKE